MNFVTIFENAYEAHMYHSPEPREDGYFPLNQVYYSRLYFEIKWHDEVRRFPFPEYSLTMTDFDHLDFSRYKTKQIYSYHEV